MQSKRCTKCGETKTSAEFHRDRTRRDGLYPCCAECERDRSRAYREANLEEERARGRAYREAHREERLAYDRAYREAHREEISARQRAYDEAHREERLAYREAHREEACAYQRAYYDAHREEHNAQIRKRKTEALDASREVATRNGEPWTPAEDHVARTSKGTVLEIAIELGRTTSSVKSRRNHLRRKAVTA